MKHAPKKSNAFLWTKIGIDIDGVLIDFTDMKVRLAKRLGYCIRPHETHGVVLKKIMSRHNYENPQRHIYGKATLALPPVAGAIKGFTYLSSRADVYVISRREAGRHYPRQWFAAHFHSFPQERIFFVGRDEYKERIAKRLGLEVFLDDRLSVLKGLPSVRQKFLLDPHSVFTKLPHGINRISSWPQFMRRVKRFL